MDPVRAQLDAIAARLAAHGSVAPGAEFAELAPEVPPVLIAAVDGSSRMLLDGGAFAVVALRAGRVVVHDAEEVLEREALLEVYSEMRKLHNRSGIPCSIQWCRRGLWHGSEEADAQAKAAVARCSQRFISLLVARLHQDLHSTAVAPETICCL